MPGDVIVIPERNGRWVVMNVFSRTCIGVEAAGLQLLRDAETLALADLEARYASTAFVIWDVWRFPHVDGLLADPTRYKRDATAWPEPERLAAGAAVARFRFQFLLIDDEPTYRRRFALKTTILDHDHFGNLHQQLGQEIVVRQRGQSDDWWFHQKFEPDGRALRPTLYQAVQGSFLEAYVKRRFHASSRILDLGCGPGFYAELMARHAASVVGLDPNARYVEQARARNVPNLTVDVAPIGTAGALQALAPASFDFVFMSDALLLYFVPPVSTVRPSLKTLLEDVRRVLAPGGTFVVLEPHYVFFMLPWLGDVDHPFTVITEYMNRSFAITGTLGDLMQGILREGFVVSWMEELRPESSFANVDARAYHFAREFPLWHLWEFRLAVTTR